MDLVGLAWTTETEAMVDAMPFENHNLLPDCIVILEGTSVTREGASVRIGLPLGEPSLSLPTSNDLILPLIHLAE
jgi:hypothetical protein